MRPGPEKQNELYLRTPAASKKTAPLKFHATVVGKFTVERELDDDIHDKIRESTQDAVNQRANRQTILIDAPLDMPPKAKAKRREEPSMFRKPQRPADKPKPAAPTPIASSSKNPSPSPSKESLALRRHLVHCLAAGDKTRDQLQASISSSNLPRPTSHDLQDALADVCKLLPSSLLLNLSRLQSRPHSSKGTETSLQKCSHSDSMPGKTFVRTTGRPCPTTSALSWPARLAVP